MEKLCVICVDDQRNVLTAVAKDLSELETWLHIDECESADECLSLIDELDSNGDKLALVISDHIMPGTTGVELLTTISTDPRFANTRKVLLTGQATHEDTIEAVNLAHIDHYFDKPWDPALLLAKVRELITRFILDEGLDYIDIIKELDQQLIYQHLK